MSASTPASAVANRFSEVTSKGGEQPAVGLALSGGGNRSAAFCLGVLQGLHKDGSLSDLDMISAVSGGSYIMSWLYLQPFYYRKFVDHDASIAHIQDLMFDPDGLFQKHLTQSVRILSSPNVGVFAARAAIIGTVGAAMGAIRLISSDRGASFALARNAASPARKFYAQSIQLSYHGLPVSAPRARLSNRPRHIKNLKPASFYDDHHGLHMVAIDPVSFPELKRFLEEHGLPGCIFGTTAHLGGSFERMELTPAGISSASLGQQRWEELSEFYPLPGQSTRPFKPWKAGFKRAPDPYWLLRNTNLAPIISGAALSEETETSERIGRSARKKHSRKKLGANVARFFNAGLDFAIPDPRGGDRSILVSDGGHSENLGLQALLRRGCRRIVVVDAEHDNRYGFSSLVKLAARAGARDGYEFRSPGEPVAWSPQSFDPDKPVFGLDAIDMKSGTRISRITYVKLSMGDTIRNVVPESVRAYERYSKKSTRRRARRRLLGTFPQESTNDQYFEPQQFLAYRDLGRTIWEKAPRGVKDLSSRPARLTEDEWRPEGRQTTTG